MRTSTAYFAGVGTVIAAVAAGLGGGYLAANIANPPPGVSKLERRMSAEPISVAAAPAQPVPRTTSPAITSAQEPQPQSQAAVTLDAPPASNNAPPAANTIRAEEKLTNNVAAVQPAQPAPQPAKLIEPKPPEQIVEKSTAPREAFATPRDATVTPRDAYAKARDADIKRAEAEKRRAERRQAWAERRKVQPRDQELDAVEERVREVTEPRRIRIREEGEPRAMFAEQPSRADVPRIRLFGQDD
jgi:hypothetical protein